MTPDELPTTAVDGLEAFLELSPDMVVVVDGDGTIVRANAEAATVVGYTPGELRGRPVEMLLPSGARSVHAAQREAFLASPSRRPMGAGRDLYARHKGGRLVPVDISLTPLPTAGPGLVAAVVRDVTERHATERERDIWRQRFATSIEAMPDPVMFLQSVRDGAEIVDFEILFANRALADAVGAARDELLGRCLLDWFPGHQGAGLFEAYAQVVADGQPREQHLADLEDVGLRGAYDVQAARLDDGLVVVFHDVTERQEIQEELRRANRALEDANAHLQSMNARLEVANRHQEAFVSTASHELRTPLTTIQGFAETLERFWEELDDDRRQTYLEAIQRSVDRQTTLLADLLDASRIRAGRLEIEVAPVDIRSVVETATEAAAVHGPVLHIDVEDGLHALADEVRLVQVVVNLITNAAKYGAPPIRIAAHRDDTGTVVLWVRDHGDGVPPSFEPSLFEMFAQASQGDRRTAKGTGLGLYIVRQLTEAMGGRVAHQRPADGGAAFVVTLPAA